MPRSGATDDAALLRNDSIAASLAGRQSRQAWVETVRSANARFARGDTYLLETD
jgi:hypothetical protein